ncbi:hypothetical protein CMI37_31240 [Candidatus Pacearchaeota archaeon]|nr:hypothetical protein [Candidatus Pacearchaeota archaeon]
MAKIYTYIFLAIGFSALLGLLGISSTFGSFMDVINPNTIIDWYSDSMFLKIVTTIAGITTGAIVLIGIFGRQAITVGITASIAAGSLVALLGDWIRVVQYANNSSGAWQGWLVSLILAPFIASYMFALWDWVRSGGDT